MTWQLPLCVFGLKQHADGVWSGRRPRSWGYGSPCRVIFVCGTFSFRLRAATTLISLVPYQPPLPPPPSLSLSSVHFPPQIVTARNQTLLSDIRGTQKALQELAGGSVATRDRLETLKVGWLAEKACCDLRANRLTLLFGHNVGTLFGPEWC